MVLAALFARFVMRDETLFFENPGDFDFSLEAGMSTFWCLA